MAATKNAWSELCDSDEEVDLLDRTYGHGELVATEVRVLPRGAVAADLFQDFQGSVADLNSKHNFMRGVRRLDAILAQLLGPGKDWKVNKDEWRRMCAQSAEDSLAEAKRIVETLTSSWNSPAESERLGLLKQLCALLHAEHKVYYKLHHKTPHGNKSSPKAKSNGAKLVMIDYRGREQLVGNVVLVRMV